MVRLTIQTYHLCNSFSFVSLLLVHYLHSERNLVPYLEQCLEQLEFMNRLQNGQGQERQFRCLDLATLFGKV